MATDSNRWSRRWRLIRKPLALLLGAAWLLPTYAVDELRLTVRQGDTLIGISERYLLRPAQWRELQQLNRVANARRLRPDSQLRIPLDWLRWSDVPAEVAFVQGVVTGNRGVLSAGMQLRPGDEFDTGAQGALTLRFADGALAVFAPQTRAALGVSRVTPVGGVRATRIDVRSGSVDTTVPPLPEPASRFDVRTPRVVTAVRGTRFRVAAEDEISRHEVVSGAVALTGSAPAALPLLQGQGVRAQAGQLGNVVVLPPAPDLSVLPRLVERTTQVLQIAPIAGASGWRWQVAADRQFTQLLQDVKTRAPTLVLTGLPDGDYQLRVRVADTQELEGADAYHVLAVRARPEPPLQLAPPAAAMVVAGTVLLWAQLPDAPSYQVQIARDAAFSDLVLDRSGVVGGRLVLDNALAPGRYFWRLATQRGDASRGPFGDAGSFTLLEPSAVAPPQLVDGNIRLGWSGPAGFSHRVQVAKDMAFSTLAQDRTVAGASLELVAPQPGLYFVRTQVVLPDGSSGPWSAVQRFEVPAPPPPPPPPPPPAPPPAFPWPWLLLLLLPLL